VGKTSKPITLIRLVLRCDESAPGVARDAARSAIRAVADDVLLVVSELVTNAVIHSGGAAGDTITLDLALHGDGVRVVVEDPGRSAGIPAVAVTPPAHGGGFGLRFVAEIACGWGVDRPNGRCSVWADLPQQAGAARKPVETVCAG